MANKEDLRNKLNELMKRADALNRDLKDLNNLIIYSDLFTEKEEKTPESIKPVVPPIVPVERKPVEEIKRVEEVKPDPTAKVIHPVEKVVPPVVIKPVVKPVIKAEPPRKSFFERNPDLEKFIGERLITFIGIAILVFGIAFFVKYAIDRDWINETGRTFIGILSGGILLGIAHRLRKKFEAFSSVLVGGGIAVLYFSISYSFQVYHLYSQTVAFLLLIIITAFTVLLSISYNRRELAIIAIAGGFGSPLMVANGGGNFPVLCTYILLLNVGMLSLAYFRKWNIVNLVSYFFTILLFGGALTQEMLKKDPAYIQALIFATAYYFTFFSMNVINNLRKKTAFHAMEMVVLLSNSFLYFGAGYYVLSHVHEGLFLGLFTAGVGVFNFIFAFALYKRQEVDRNLVYFLIGLVLTFVSLAGPVQLHGHYITLFWSAEAVILLWLYQRSRITMIRFASLLVNFLAVISLLIDWVKLYGPDNGLIDSHQLGFRITGVFVTSIFVLLSFAGTIWLLIKDKNAPEEKFLKPALYRRILSVAFLVILYFGFLLEIQYQFRAHSFSIYGPMIIFSLYSSLFMMFLLICTRIQSLAFLRAPAAIAGLLLLLSFFEYPHMAVVEARNRYLFQGLMSERFPFILHYVNSLVMIIVIFQLRKLVFSYKELDKLLRSMFLWFICLVLVYLGSAELDHFFVIANYDANHPDPSTALELSHRIGYPIFWGLFSFAIIVTGMKRRSRQLRIISLSLFFVTIIKLISLGIYGESEAGKIIAFISSGVILLIVAFMYQKLKKLFVAEDENKENTPPETRTV